MNSSFVASAFAGMQSPTLSLDGDCLYVRRTTPVSLSDRTDSTLPHRLTDSEREAAIKRAGDLIVHYMNKWEETSDFQYRGDADRARRLMEILIKGRSPEQIARMERERGLA